MKTRIALTLICMMIFIMGSAADAAYLVHQNGSLPLVSQKVNVRINNQVAVTSLEMLFENTSEFTIRPNIRFPIHEKASVQNFSLTDSEGVKYSGTIQESQQAKETFAEAQAEGLMPAMAVQKRPGIFEASIGAIGPNSRATVTLEYSEILPYKNGVIDYKLPFNISHVQKSSLDTSSIVIELEDQKEIVSLRSSTHDIYADKIDNNNWRSVFEKSNYLPTGDFAMSYEVKAEALATNFLTTRPEADSDGYFLLMLSPAEVVGQDDIANRDIVFIIDTSGSMNGFKMEQTKKAFSFFIEKLNENDRFGLIDFSSHAKLYQEELQEATPANRNSAALYVNNLRAGGGTNIHDSLQSALRLFDATPDRTRTIVFMTDGEATNGVIRTDQIVSLFKGANNHNVRTFTLGVGKRLNRELLNKLALENRGESVYIDESSQKVDEQLMAFYKTISTPLLVDLALDFGNIEVSDMYPKTLPNIYQGTQLVISGRYKNGGDAEIKLTGKLNAEDKVFAIKTGFAENSQENLFVSRFWAKAKADDLMLQMQTYGQNHNLKNEVIELSKKYQFATPFTSFVAVSEIQVPQVAEPSKLARNTGSARNAAAMARPSTPPVRRTVVKQTKAKGVSLWGASGFLPVAAIAIPNFRKARQQARSKACAANMRVIQGAVEMYNMDHEQMMDVVTINELEILVQKGYLKALPTAPTDECAYGTHGSLIADGVICCARHGTVENLIDPDVNSSNYSSGDSTFFDPNTGTYVRQIIDVKSAPTPWHVRIWNDYLVNIVSLAINVPLFILGLVFSLYVAYIVLSIPFIILRAFFSMFSQN